MLRLLRDLDHVGVGDPDIFRGHIGAAQRLDRAAECREQFGRFDAALVRQDHALAAAHRQARHRVLVTHAARQAQRVGDRRRALRIVPIAHAARAGAEMRRMDRDDRRQPAGAIAEHVDMLMIVEIGEIPDSRHARLLALENYIKA